MKTKKIGSADFSLLPIFSIERETGPRKHHARHAHVIGRPVSIQELDNKNRSILSDTPIFVIERETGLERPIALSNAYFSRFSY